MDRARCSRLENQRVKFLDSSFSSTSLLMIESFLIEILARLPCRTAVRLKLVCKRWYSIISSPFFVAFFNHRRHDPSLPPVHDPDLSSSRLVIQFGSYGGYFLHYDRALLVPHPVMVHRWLDFSFLPCPNKNRIAVKASCNDLLLCSYSQLQTPQPLHTDFYVCNLQTQQWISLPPIDHPLDNYVFGLLCVPSPCSLCHHQGGMDNSRCNFFAMRIHPPLDAMPSTQIKFDLFSSQEGEWKNYVVSSPLALPNYHLVHHIVPFKGMLHWLNYPYIVVFDHCNAPGKISRIIDIQIDSGTAPSIRSFGVCCGRLRLAHSTMSQSPVYECLWELEDYETGKWSLVKQFIVPETSRTFYVHPDGTTVYGNSRSSLWISDFQAGLLYQKYEFVPRGHQLHTNVLFYSIIVNAIEIGVQGWPTPVPSLLS